MAKKKTIKKKIWNIFKRFSTVLSTEEVENRLYSLFLIQNSAVTNYKEEIAEEIIAYVYQITCICDLMYN